MNEESTDRPRINRQPYQVHLPGFITEENIGLGDLIKRVTSTLGFTPCGGCQKRADALNSNLVFTRRAR